MANNKYSIREAAKKFDLSEMYIGHMIRDGKLMAKKDSDGHWMIEEAAIQAYMDKRMATKSSGTRKCIIYVTTEQYSKLKAEGFDIDYAYQSKKMTEEEEA